MARWICLAFWTALSGLRLVEAWQEKRATALLLAVQAGLVCWLLLSRRQERTGISWLQKMLAWSSALMPLGMRIFRESLVGQAMLIIGLLLVLWSFWTLGGSFGIAPADRGLVVRGPYRFIRHPAYLGELACLSGVVVSNLSAWNILLLHILVLAILVRIRWEEQVIASYDRYARQVPWRLVPGIW
jgi:protein-S-isoprenylcysteine O-methyltransferase Ste14